MKHIAVLLTVYNRKESTIRCLEGVYTQIIPNNIAIDIYMTEDGCTDGTPESVKEKFPKVNIIHGNGNLYWNRGMWEAWQAAITKHSYDYFLWLNDDTFTYSNMISALLNIAEKKNNKAIIIGPTIDANGKNIHTYGGRKGKELVPLNGDIQECETFNGNIVLIPASVYNTLGCNDPYFHHSLGDLDYGLRARQKGIKIYQIGVPVGECNRHERIMNWCNPEIKLNERWRILHQPTGYPPKEVWHFNKRHYGFVKAIYYIFTTYVRCLFPNIWIKMNKANWI